MHKRLSHFFCTLILFLAPLSVFAVVPNDGLVGNQWYLPKIRAFDAWETQRGLDSVIVAILDSGVDIDHEDLVGNLYTNLGEVAGDGVDNDNNGFVDDVHGWDFFDNDADPRPVLNGNPGEIGVHHGTVIAGIVGAQSANSTGVSGVAWDVSLLPVRVLNTSGDGTIQTIVDGVDYAVRQGADVINLSFVGEFDSDAMRDAIERAYEQGVVVVAALGNDARDLDVDPIFPACSFWSDDRNIVIGVAATNADDARADFSNYGKRCADLAAPGVSIYSTQMSSAGLGLYGGGWSGTSLAAPIVSGVAALLRASFPTITPSMVLTALQTSVDPVIGLNPKAQSGTLGAGRVNAQRALAVAAALVSAQEVAPVVVPEEPSGDAATEVAPAAARAGAFDRPFAISSRAGDGARVETSESTFESSHAFVPYPGFAGDVRVAIGQFDDDAPFEVATAPGEGGGPHIKVFSLTGVLESEFFAYDPAFRGGVSIASADVDGDGVDEILTAPGRGHAPVVKFHRKSGALMNDVALETDGASTLNIAAGDIDGDGADDVIVSSEGGEPRVYVYRLYGTQQTSFLAYAPHERGALHADVFVTAAGKRYVVTRMASDINAHVRFFTFIGAFVGQFTIDAKAGDYGDLSVWQPYNEASPVITTSQSALGKPAIFLYNEDGSLADIQLSAEFEYKRPMHLSR